MMMSKDNRPHVLLLATPHFVEEWWGDHREAEVEEVVKLLARFAPDVIAVEAMPKAEPKIQEQYERFLAGDDLLNADEIHQLAFRLAQTCGVSDIRGFDADWYLEWGGLRKLYPMDDELEAVLSRARDPAAGLRAKLDCFQTEGATVREMLQLVNSREYQELDHQVYVRIAELGDADNTAGADYTGSWYLRNVRMYANLVRQARSGHRTFALVGAGHAKILNDLLRQGGLVDIADPLDHLT